MTLTKQQRKILEFIKEYDEDRGYAPTLSEIGSHFGLRSPATVYKHLKNLERKGAVRRQWNHRRSIEVMPEAGATRAFDLPIVGELERGRPIEWRVASEAVPVPSGLVGDGRTFVLQVRGGGFAEDLLRNGDYVVIEEAESLPDGALGLIQLHGQGPVLRRIERQGDELRLVADEPGVAARLVEPSELRVRGRVIGVIRKY